MGNDTELDCALYENNLVFTRRYYAYEKHDVPSSMMWKDKKKDQAYLWRNSNYNREKTIELMKKEHDGKGFSLLTK